MVPADVWRAAAPRSTIDVEMKRSRTLFLSCLAACVTVAVAGVTSARVLPFQGQSVGARESMWPAPSAEDWEKP